MPSLPFTLGLRRLLLLVVALALLPCFVLVVFNWRAERQALLLQAHAQVEAVAGLVALQADQAYEGAAQLLAAASAVPAVLLFDKPRCDAFFVGVHARFPAYGNLGAIDASGQLVCSAVANATAQRSMADRTYFRQATSKGSLAVELVKGRLTGAPSLTFALPFYGGNGQLRGVTFAALTLSAIDARLRSLSLPAHLQAFILTTDGTVLGSAPQGAAGVGNAVPYPGIVAALRQPGNLAETRLPADIAIEKVIASSAGGASGLHIAVRSDVQRLLAPADQRMRAQLAALTLLVASSAVAALVIGDRRLVRPAAQLLMRIRALERGELPTAPRPSGSPELDQLNRAFTVMHEQLALRKEQLERALGELGQAHERLSTSQRLSHTAYWEWNIEANRLWVPHDLDESALASHGTAVSLSDFLTRVADEDRSEVEKAIRATASGDGAFELEHRAVASDGTAIWMRTSGELVRDDAGRPTRVRGSLQDVTRRMAAETSAQALAQRLASTLDIITDGFFTLDSEWRFTYVNRSGEELLRVPRAELIGRCIWDVFSDDSSRPYRDAYERATALGRPQEVEAYYAPLDLWVQCAAYPAETGLAVYFKDITERKRAEQEREALLESERRTRREAEAAKLHFRALFESAPGLYLVLAPDERATIVAASEAYLKATCTRREDIIGKPMFEVFPDDPNDLHATGVMNLRRSIARVRETGRADVMAVQRYPIRKPSGADGDFEERYWSPFNSPVFGPDGELVYVIHRVEDVTEFVRDKERRGKWAEGMQTLASRAEQMEADVVLRSLELQRLNERLRAAQRVAQLGSWDLHLADHTLAWSEETHRIFGLAAAGAALTFERVLEAVHPDDRQRVRAAHLTGLELGRDLDLEYRIWRLDGEERTLHCRATLIANDQGVPVMLTGTVQDITERKRVDQRLHAQLAQLNLLHQITRAIGDRMHAHGILAIVLAQLETYMPVDATMVLAYDPHHERLTVSDIGNSGIGALQGAGLQLGSEWAAKQNGLAKAVDGTLIYEPAIANLTYSFTRHMIDAGVGSMVLAPLRSEQTTYGVLLAGRKSVHGFTSTDCEFLGQLSEHVALAMRQAQLHHSLQAAFDELRRTQQAVLQHERLRALGEMASGIAHDINNAISPVTLYVESLLNREVGLSNAGRTKLETIRLAIDDVADTVERMGVFYRREDATGRRVPVSLNQVVGQVIGLTQARWRDQAQQAGVVIEVKAELDETLPDMVLNESEMREALTNLVLNAVDSMPSGGAIRVQTSHLHDGPEPEAQVTVSDSGCGMDEVTRRRSVEPFFTTKGERGTGLGLAVVYGIVQRHRGHLDIQSAPGRGTSVTIRIPIHGGGGEAHSEARPILPERPLRVLLVDDDPLVLRPLSEALFESGHNADQCSDSREAVKRVEQAVAARSPYDAVITDLGMPGLDGRSVAREVKRCSPSTRVVMLTGWGRRMTQNGDRPPAVDVLLSKPPRIQEVLTALSGA
jgi:PAS domain S-box-containing protein